MEQSHRKAAKENQLLGFLLVTALAQAALQRYVGDAVTDGVVVGRLDAKLIEAIHQQIAYYNNKRIHSAHKMPPVTFRIRHNNKTTTITVV